MLWKLLLAVVHAKIPEKHDRAVDALLSRRLQVFRNLKSQC